jgi:FdhD protein
VTSNIGVHFPGGLAKRPGPSVRRTVTEVVGEQRRTRPDSVVTEEPLEIRLSWPGHDATRVAVTMRTPGADFELATGYLLAEGTTRLGTPPRTVAYCVDRSLSQQQQYNVVTVQLDAPPLRHPSARATAISSACGVCGAESLDEVFTPDHVPLQVGAAVRDDVIVSLPDALRERQPLFARTGSIHACGVFDFDGELVVAREDVGRHNTVDKVLGARELGNASYHESSILCVSGRVGFDIITKAVAGRIAVVVAVGGPSSLAVELADRAGITLCGFTRGGRYVAYTHPERLPGV